MLKFHFTVKHLSLIFLADYWKIYQHVLTKDVYQYQVTLIKNLNSASLDLKLLQVFDLKKKNSGKNPLTE